MLSGKKKFIDTKTTDTLIGESTRCEGHIVSEASLRIEGWVHGDIECAGDVTIGENAVLHSNIQAREVIIAGKVRGDISTTGKLTILHTGELIGNINVRSFTIQDGGLFQGTSSMNGSTGSSSGSTAHGSSSGSLNAADHLKVIDAPAPKANSEPQAASAPSA